MARFRKADPIPVPEIVIPVVIAQQIACMGLTSASTPRETAVRDLALIAFSYILQVGDYTQISAITVLVQFNLG